MRIGILYLVSSLDPLELTLMMVVVLLTERGRWSLHLIAHPTHQGLTTVHYLIVVVLQPMLTDVLCSPRVPRSHVVLGLHLHRPPSSLFVVCKFEALHQLCIDFLVDLRTDQILILLHLFFYTLISSHCD